LSPEEDTLFSKSEYQSVLDDSRSHDVSKIPTLLANYDDIAIQQKWDPRTKQVLDVLQKELSAKSSVTFSELSRGVSKRAASVCFLEILQLKTFNVISAKQSKPFGQIVISAV